MPLIKLPGEHEGEQGFWQKFWRGDAAIPGPDVAKFSNPPGDLAALHARLSL